MNIHLLALKPECEVNPDCPRHLACILEKCQDPCSTLTCGVNAECGVSNHVAVCSCRSGYEGDPYSFCRERKREQHRLDLLSIFIIEHVHFILFQRGVTMTMNVHFPKLVFNDLARILVCMMTHVELMLSVVSRHIMLSALVYQRQREIPTSDVTHMNVSLMMIAPQH